MRAWYTFDGAEEEDAACWTANFLWFMKKVGTRPLRLTVEVEV